MLKKITKSLSALLNGGEAERWSTEKLAEVKSYLEGKPAETFTREDHHLCVDFLLHRYFPKDVAITKATWEERRGDLLSKVDWNIDHPEEAKSSQEVKDDPDFAEWLKNTLSNTE